FLCACLLCLFTCEKERISTVKNQQIFLEIWEYINENYVYFAHKEVDWMAVRTTYEPLINEELSEADLAETCYEMLNTLRDGHNRLTTKDFNKNYPYEAGYSTHFDLDLIKKHYLLNEYQERGFYTYGVLQDSLAYVHFRRFEQVKKIHAVMNSFTSQAIKGLIFDLRGNPGGVGRDAVEIVGHFIDQTLTVGFIVEKTGRGQNDFSPPLPVLAKPKAPFFDVPIKVLINRDTYSAATYLTAQLKDLPNVTLVGQVTGGGGGGNQTQELSNGWLLTISSSKFLDVRLNESLEDGIPPNITVVNDSLTLASGTDEMLERAIASF
ncbi:MAG: S41 family peptidase, partial [Bacteroidota bacterium]